MERVILPGRFGTEPPRALLGHNGAVDHRDAETWRLAGCEPILPPADDRNALVRFDLADTALGLGLRCVAAIVATAQTREAWLMVAEDLASAHGRTGDTSKRRLLSASAEAAEELSEGRLDRALQRLAQNRGVTVDAWIMAVREERDAKGGAR